MAKMNYYHLLYDGQYDRLVTKALPVVETDEDARRAYLRLFMALDTMFLLAEDTIEMLCQEADKNNPYAQYGYARYLVCVRPEKDSLKKSFDYAEAAMKGGIADAKAMVALAIGCGDTGMVDYEREDTLMNEAVKEGSELALMYVIKKYLYGSHFKPTQPDKALELLEQLIAKEEQSGAEVNGWWYFYRASAKEAQLGRMAVINDYRRALSLGVLRTYCDLILAYGYGDRIEDLHDTEEYREYMSQGLWRRASDAYLLDAARLMDTDDNELIVERLEDGARLGNTACTEQLGDLYYNGAFGCKKDMERAASYYEIAARHDSVSAAEKLWDMMHDHDIDRPLDYRDSIALIGTRSGSLKLLAETVIAHQEGRLNDYAEEIEKYYEPIFDSEDYPHIDVEDHEDDDGRYDAWA